MNKSSKIFIAGGQSGLVGKAIVRKLHEDGYRNLIIQTRKQLDLTNQKKVEDFFLLNRPEYVFLAAAKVGGIFANKTQKADFIYQNLVIQNNVIYSSWKYKVKKLLFLGSSCIYPKFAPQPIKESYLLTGQLEETNDAYAIAKIAGIKLCQSFNEQYQTNFISVMPTNLYGPNDNYDPSSSHVIPALIKKFYDAKVLNLKVVSLWGTGNVYREFLHVDDLATACIFLMKKYNDSEPINVGTGRDISIRKLAQIIKKIVVYRGKVEWDKSMPAGTPRKNLDISKISKLGWKPSIKLLEGIEKTINWFIKSQIS